MSKLVSCVSVFLLVLGITIASYGFIVLGGGENPIKSDYNPNFDPNVAGKLIALIAGLLCVVTAILGLLTAKCKKFYFALPSMILFIVIGLLMLVGGAITSGAGGYMSEMQNLACNE